MSSSPPSGEPPVLSPPFKGAVMLIVEDNDDSRTLLATMLALYGAQVLPVPTVQKAMEALTIVRPDIVVADINLPGEDGYSLVRRIRALSPEQGGLVPVLAVTALGSSDDRARLLDAGFQEHLAKPVDPDDLVGAIQRLLGR